jgi:hypothetical protein
MSSSHGTLADSDIICLRLSRGYPWTSQPLTDAYSLLGVILHPASEAAVARMINGYLYFKIGASWGGYESLVTPSYPARVRTVVPWTETGFVLRYSGSWIPPFAAGGVGGQW